MPKTRAKQQSKVLRDFKICFVAYFGQDPTTHEWAVILQDSVAKKQSAFRNANLKAACTEAYKRIRKRELFNRKYPPPEPGRIITLDQEVRKFIVGPGGKLLRP